MEKQDITTGRIKRETLQKLRIVAAIEGQTPIEWMEWVVDKAYEASVKSNKHN